VAISERFQGANVVDAGRLSPYWGEHAARYRWALSFVTGKCVLDIACGTGYGLGILGTEAREVVGVDVDEEAAHQAKQACPRNAAVILGDGLGLPFSDGTFDVITSFETLEHLHQRREFLAELARVLVARGLLLLSTPNANFSKPLNGKPLNPFHIHEYKPQELQQELSRYFTVETFMGQTLDPSTGIPPFFEAQNRLPKDLPTQTRLLGWKVFNKIPFSFRERLSDLIWSKPFYPTEADYNFDESTVDEAVTLVAVCRKT
jgi:ubiquinone/menaquinone biosynthesis C-methylase UbiE